MLSASIGVHRRLILGSIRVHLCSSVVSLLVFFVSLVPFDGLRTGFVVSLLFTKLAPPGRVLLFPISAVGLRDGHVFDRARIEAARVDAEAVRVRARDVEGLDAAHRAEQVLGDTRIKGVRGQRVLTAEEGEAVGGNDQVQVAGLAADRTVALENTDSRRRDHLEAYLSTVTATCVLDHREF
jgi:hypothetical protein